MNPNRPRIISIEGNIGSGKTTLVDHLEHHYRGQKYIFLKEPVPVWTAVQDDETGENILQKMYRDPEKYAFPFQIMAYITFYQRLVEAFKTCDSSTIIVCERSMDSCRHVFAKMLYHDGRIDSINYKILEMFYNQVDPIPLDAIIYLETSVETSNERIKKRARLGENDIAMDYLDNCRKYHEEWLSSISLRPPLVHVEVILPGCVNTHVPFVADIPILRVKETSNIGDQVAMEEIMRFLSMV